MAAEDQEKHIDPQEIMHELAQCREDERASKSQIFQILSTTATFLTVVTAIFTALKPDNSLFTSSESLYIILYLLTILVASASASYIANLGLMSTFRHHYMVDLERKLTVSANSGEGMIHWETVSKPFITMNPKHIGTGIFSLFSINAVIALLSILTLAFVFTTMQTFIILKNFPYMAPYVWLALALYTLVLLISAGTLLVSMYRSKELYLRSLEKAISQNFQRPNHKGVFSYYIYPRPKDVQKVVFIALGYAMGCILSCLAGAAVFSWQEFVRGLLVTLLILDGLVYQARYLWNDVRGAHGDQGHPLAKARGRLPVAALGFGPAVFLALAVMFLRLIAAAICIFLLGPEQWLPLGVSCVLILLLGVRYESVRTRGRMACANFTAALAQGDAAGRQDGALRANRCARQTIFWVCFGYPLRWLAGLWSAYPMLPRFALEQTNYALSLFLLFFSIAAFGGAFVTMTWILEAVHITQDKSDAVDPMAQFYKKPHLLYLLTMLPSAQWQAEHPIQAHNTAKCLWNKLYLTSTVLLALSALFLSPQQPICRMAAVLIGLTSLIPMLLKLRSTAEQIAAAAAPAILLFLALWAMWDVTFFAFRCLFCLAEALQLLYLIVYISFRCSNYAQLYSALDDLLHTLSALPGLLWGRAMALLVGRDTINALEREKAVKTPKAVEK